MPRLWASRLAVPAGMIAIGTPVPASASHERCTIPSPPHTTTRSAPASTASAHPLGRLLALLDLEPQQLVDPGDGQAGAQLVEPATEGLPAVRDDGDGPDPARVAVG